MKSEKKNVLLIANTSWYVFNFKGSLIRKLVRNGYNVYYFSLDHVYRDELDRIGCECFFKDIRTGRTKNIFRFWSSKRARKIDHIYTFTLVGTIFGSIYKNFQMRDAKIYNTITGLGNVYLIPILGKYVLKKVYRLFLRNSNCVFVQNSSDKKFIESICNPSITLRLVAGSGVDTSKFRQVTMPCKNKIKLLIATRLIDNKGLKELFTVMLRLQPIYGNIFELHVCGNRNLSRASNPLKRLIKKSESMGAVKFIGHVDDMPTLLGKYDAAVLPSYREGLSKFLLEAAAVGRPLLVSDVPGCRELVQHGVNGLLFKSKDTEDLQNCIVEFLNLEQKTRVQMGKASRELIEKAYEEQQVIEKYIEILH